MFYLIQYIQNILILHVIHVNVIREKFYLLFVLEIRCMF